MMKKLFGVADFPPPPSSPIGLDRVKRAETRWRKVVTNFADFKASVCRYIDRRVQINGIF